MRLNKILNTIIIPVTFSIVNWLVSISSYAQQNSISIDSLITSGDSLRAIGNFDEAKEIYKAALKIDNDLIQAYAGLGKIAIAEEKWAEAGDEFQKVLDRDPENKQAHYFRGISSRETGKFKVLLLRKLDWDKSKKHFQKVMAQDSLYQDVIYQFAKLKRYREEYPEAIQWGHTQVRLRPELVEPRVKLFRFYRYYINHTKNEQAINWLKHQPWDHARYAIGEKFRREGNLTEADSVFREMLKTPLTMSRQPIFLSLARINYEKQQPEEGEKYFWRAVNESGNDIDADLVFEDIKYILKDDELEHYRSLKSIPLKIEFFHKLWISRDPTPAASVNHRLAEHYRRLLYSEKNYEFDGFRTWFNNPDKLGYLDFTKTYDLNHEFNDKGLIYIRHGQYDDWAITGGPDVPSNESWMYNRTTETPEMIFHFFLENTPGYWRFSPVITDRRLLEDRVHFGNIYYRLLRADRLEYLAITEEMARESRKYVSTGLSTDRNTWETKLKPLETPFSMATFRSDRGKTILEIYYAISLSAVAREIKQHDQRFELEKGITIHNLNWQPIEKKRDKIFLPIRESESFLDLYRFEVQPDSYHVAFYARPADTDLLGGWKFGKRVDDYSTSELSISDIQLATKIEPTSKISNFEKNGLLVVPNPTRLFSLKVPVYIYFEIYQLTQDLNRNTSFTIEYSLTLLKQEKKGFLGFFAGRGKTSITTKIDREGNSELSVEYLAIDASRVKAGEYELAVKVTDKHSGKTAIRTTKIALQ